MFFSPSLSRPSPVPGCKEKRSGRKKRAQKFGLVLYFLRGATGSRLQKQERGTGARGRFSFILLLLFPLGLEHELVGDHGRDGRRGGDRQGSERILAAPDAVGSDGERTHASGEEVELGEALFFISVEEEVERNRLRKKSESVIFGDERKKRMLACTPGSGSSAACSSAPTPRTQSL